MDVIDSIRAPDRWRAAFADFAQGARQHIEVRRLTRQIVEDISAAFSACGFPVHVELDQPNETNKKPANLIVFFGACTELVPLKVGGNMIQVGKIAVFLAHAGGPMLLVNALADAIELCCR
jgi:hypothetical protein